VEKSRYTYVLLNKPRGVLSAVRDDRGRVVVTDLVDNRRGLHPVGRLDLESEGLVLLTNDGHLTNLLTHPSHEVEKEYLVRIDAPIATRDLARMTRGIESEGETLKAASARVASPTGAAENEYWLVVTLREGKKREIRRMLAALGRTAVLLRRVRLGTLALGALKPGQSRELTPAEVDSLYRIATGARR
jgi:23S rRNA pseudouridine2605 synthase